MAKNKKLYTVANAHLDTQWNWTIQDTIRDCVKNTLERNFDLLEKYPHYRMNFEGAFRYKLAKEYYPEMYEKLKEYVAEGRWNVAGSSWDACDVNVPSSEALMRQILYGNGYFEQEFGKKSTDIFLTDCFGFRYSLPSVEAHMGLNGFSTQKLVWGVGSPIYNEDGTVSKPMPDREHPRMDLGKWVGPDGNFVIASLLEGDYTYNFDRDNNTTPVHQREEYLKRIEHNEKFTGTPVRSMYYGTGDYGGSPKEASARMINEAIEDNRNGLYEVVSASTDQIFNELTPEEIDALPAYDGELLIPHGSGALTSHTISKRWNRKNELLADSAERAAVLASWLGAAEYPADRLLFAWQTFLWHQFHDDLPGTSIAEAYVFTYNDYVIALNMFAAELNAAVGAVAGTLDTRVQGTPIVVYNPVSSARRDLVTAELDIASPYVRVFDGQGREVPAQLSQKDGRRVVKFIAPTEPVSCSVFDVRESDVPGMTNDALIISGNTLENQRYLVTIDENGDIASIKDKANGNFELLSAPARLEIGPDSSTTWPSWELVCDDSLKEPEVVAGKPEIEIVENGPAVISLKITRTFDGSVFEQTVSLWDNGQRVDVDNRVQWYQRKSNLRAAFPLSVSNPKATFDLGLGAIESGNTDTFPYYQHVAHQWADLTAEDGSYGVSILNDCKYGMDKPNDNTLRLTLIHTPLGAFSQQSGQDWQDMGLNLFTYSITGHAGFREETNKEAAELNQPMMPFIAGKHEGANGSAVSLVSLDRDAVILRAVKKEEKGSRMIVRVQETSGKLQENCKLTFLAPIASAVETNGYEDELGAADYADNAITFTLTPYAVKTFAVTLTDSPVMADKTNYTALDLPYDRRVTTANSDRTAGEFADGISIPEELYQQNVVSGGVPFTLGCPKCANAVVSAGQKLTIPAGSTRLYLLAASAKGDKKAVFTVGGKEIALSIQDFRADVGAWDQMVNGKTCLVKRDEIAVNYTHTHNADGDRLYLFAYLFKYVLDVTGAEEVILPDDSDILVMAATVCGEQNTVLPAAPLYDRVDHEFEKTYTLTVDGTHGSGSYPAGKVIVLRTSAYKDGKMFEGWDGGDILWSEGPCAIIRMPEKDLHVSAVYRSLGEDVVLNKPCRASSEFNRQETADNALNGNDNTKWCAASDDGRHWLEVDLGETVSIGRWMVMHCGVHESPSWNTSDFRLEYRLTENDEWQTADSVTGNTENMTVRDFAPVDARYVRLFIEKACVDGSTTARIFMLQVFKA